jgi:hypothetical protein
MLLFAKKVFLPFDRNEKDLKTKSADRKNSKN